MSYKSVTLIGATGLIGNHLLEFLINDSDISSIKILLRKPINFNHPKVSSVVLDFANQSAYKSALEGSDIVFCAIGTTNAKMNGDKSAYRKVDYDIPVHAAQYCKEIGCSQFAFVSSIGADSKHTNFYLKLKGEVEEAITAMEIPSVYIFCPSLLLGKRKEFRLGESIGKFMIKPLSFLFPSSMKPIQASTVAKSMLKATKIETKGPTRYYYKEMLELANR